MKTKTNGAASTVRSNRNPIAVTRNGISVDRKSKINEMITQGAGHTGMSPRAFLEYAIASQIPKFKTDLAIEGLDRFTELRSPDALVKLATAMAEFIQDDGALIIPMTINVRLFPSELVALARQSKHTGRPLEEIVGDCAGDAIGEAAGDWENSLE